MKKKVLVFIKYFFVIVLLGLIVLMIFLTLKSEVITSEEPLPVSFEIIDSTYSKEANTLIELISEIRNEWNLPSLSIAVGFNNQLVFTGIAGYSEIDSSVPASLRTTYRIGRISKPITATALAILEERNKISFSDTVQHILPTLYSHSKPITLKQLASHTSGIKHYEKGISFFYNELMQKKQYRSIEESLYEFTESPLLFSPGTDFYYSSNGYNLLARIIEKASGSEYFTFISEEILNKSKMHYTSLEDYPNFSQTSLASFYLPLPFDRYIKAPDVNNSNKWASGGFVSTPSDLIRFSNSLLNYELVSKDQIDLMFTPITLIDGKLNEQNYGIGWRIDPVVLIVNNLRTEFRTVHHGGNSAGSMTFLLMFPDQKLSIVMATNTNPNNAGELRGKMYSVAKIFLSND